jgi:peroxiredoxin
MTSTTERMALPHNKRLKLETSGRLVVSVLYIVDALTMTSSKPLNLSRRQTILAATAWSATAATGLSGCSGNTLPSADFLLIDGSVMPSRALQGKVTLVNFWATTCVSCVKEMPALVQTHQTFKDRGFETVAVAMSYDPPAWVLNFAQSRQLPFKVALDHNGAVAQAWGDIKLTPTTFIVNRQGDIVKRYVGEPDFVALHQLLDRLLTSA